MFPTKHNNANILSVLSLVSIQMHQIIHLTHINGKEMGNTFLQNQTFSSYYKHGLIRVKLT